MLVQNAELNAEDPDDHTPVLLIDDIYDSERRQRAIPMPEAEQMA